MENVQIAFYNPSYREHVESYYLTEEQRQFTGHPYDAIIKCESEENRFPFLILAENQLAGFFVLHGWEGVKEYSDNQKALLLRTYSVQSTFQGRGIAQESLRLLPVFVKEHFPEVVEIILAVNHGNHAAQHVYTKSGFIDKGIRAMGRKGELFILHLEL